MRSNDFSRRCFTLVELLVATAITLAIVFLFVKMIETVRRTVKLSNQLMDATAKTRFIFDRMAMDFKEMPKRMDIDYCMTNNVTGEDFMRIITRVKGPGGDRGVSLVGYKIEADEKGVYGLYRGIHGYHWKDVGFMGVNAQGFVPRLKSLLPELDLKQSDYELLASGIIKVAFAFQYKSDGKIYQRLPYYYEGTNYQASLVQITNIGSIVVGMAVMDLKETALLTRDVSDKLASKFTEVPEGVTPLPQWNTNIEENFSAFAEGLPKPVAQSVRVYQRFYPLNE
ncbi:MAG: hypothetical protein V4507_05880 [Verrucomicrobiota bacterium]